MLGIGAQGLANNMAVGQAIQQAMMTQQGQSGSVQPPGQPSFLKGG